jgi:hypothetical protein
LAAARQIRSHHYHQLFLLAGTKMHAENFEARP